ncbi:50S ribosomal protein L25/general stress protein Ctc [Pseudomonas sp. gcc21]|uniref:50S ribosomal protein L25/general stress protein Ctc n=1 Tax=Pseudomonas sp. gcc21 TaxID=2726989 RepID=UPI0014516DFA|nr:50S ribosomal protein L25/general stress protein Ctc [Pseudomonas sp. gcc21]QJD60308.1 50S ribosomal protein L25/general stress protein Ctc [Pseudomonas sp. gcc21]
MVDFTLNAKERNDLGKGASRRLRRIADLVPAIVYGGNKAPQSISLETRQLNKALESEAFYSHIISLDVDGKKEDVLLKAVQRHPSKPRIMHVDFLRVVAGHKVNVQVPLHFLNEDTCFGVKQEGGMIFRNLPEIEITCLPKDLPEAIEVDLIDLKLGEVIHLSDLKLPKGVTIPSLALGADHDLPVVNVMAPRVAAEDDQASEEGEESAE